MWKLLGPRPRPRFEARSAAAAKRQKSKGEAMIDIDNVTKVYALGESEVRALDGINLHIAQGEMTAIMGPSGSGKSTLLAIVGCLDVPTTGTYTLDGVSVENLKDDELAAVRSRKIGVVFQQF